MAVTFSDICAIVPAAGFGRRMQINHPKQYLSIGNKTILEHSVSALLSNLQIAHIVIAISPNDTFFSTLTLANHPRISIVKGGKERADSVMAGIQAIEKAQWVLIHDANRPCLHQDDLARLLSIRRFTKIGGILAMPVSDTIKKRVEFFGKNTIAHTVDRVDLWHAMTPQFFPRKLLQKCLQHALNNNAIITDEASALEYCGLHPELIKGRTDNIKVTYPEDLKLAELYLTYNKC